MRKWLKTSISAVSVVIATSSVAMTAACASNSNPKTIKQFDNFIDVYPEIFVDEFYPYIDFVNGSPHISDNMIAKFVKKVVTDMAITDGNISWGYKREPDGKTASIGFIWEGSQETQSRTYQIRLNEI